MCTIDGDTQIERGDPMAWGVSERAALLYPLIVSVGSSGISFTDHPRQQQLECLFSLHSTPLYMEATPVRYTRYAALSAHRS